MTFDETEIGALRAENQRLRHQLGQVTEDWIRSGGLAADLIDGMQREHAAEIEQLRSAQMQTRISRLIKHSGDGMVSIVDAYSPRGRDALARELESAGYVRQDRDGTTPIWRLGTAETLMMFDQSQASTRGDSAADGA